MKKAQTAWKLKRDWKGDSQMRREASLRGISFGRHPKVSTPIKAPNVELTGAAPTGD